MRPQVRDNQFTLLKTNLEIDEDILLFLYDSELAGIFILDDCQNLGDDNIQSPQCYQAKLSNLFWQYQVNQLEQYVVIIGEYIELGNKLSSLIPKLKYPLPQLGEVAEIVAEFIPANLSNNLAENIELYQNTLVRACQGLSKGEIKLILQRYGGLNNSILRLAELVINYKQQKLQSEGLEFISEPDIPTVGGMDLILNHVRNVVKLMSPEAQKYNLSPPKGMLLLGPPGTGKSLVAKLTAKELGVPLLGGSWGNILSSYKPDKSLANLLEIAATINAVKLT